MSAIRKTNDPERPEWGLFRDLSGRDWFRPGMDEAQASARLKEAMWGLYATEPLRFLAAVGGKSLQARLGDMDGAERAKFTSFLCDHLVVGREDGKINFAKALEHADSNLALDAWRPSDGGFVPYARMVLARGYEAWDKHQTEQAQKISLDQLRDQGVELAADQNPFPVAQNDDREDDDASPRVAKSHYSRADAEEDEAAFVAEKKHERAESLAAKEFDAAMATDDQRPEFTFFGLALETVVTPESSATARECQLVALAKELVGRKCDPQTPEIATELQALNSWSPRDQSFFEVAPTATRSIVDGLAPKQPRIRSYSVTPPRDRDTDFSLSVARNVGLLPDSDASLEPRQDSMFESMRSFAFAEMVEERATPESVNSPERPDYQFLCDELGITPASNLSPLELHGQLRELAARWVKVATLPSADFKRGLARVVAEWDPKRDGFMHEALAESLRPVAEAPRARQFAALKKWCGPLVTEKVIGLNDRHSGAPDLQLNLGFVPTSAPTR